MGITMKRPATAQDLRDTALQVAQMFNAPEQELTTGAKGVIVYMLDNLFGGSERRKMVLGYLFTPQGERLRSMSSKELTPGMWFFLKEIWLQPDKIDGQWMYYHHCRWEAIALSEYLHFPEPDNENKPDKPVRGRAI